MGECGKEGVSEAPMAMPRSGHQWACIITCPGHHKNDKDDEDDERTIHLKCLGVTHTQEFLLLSASRVGNIQRSL